MPDKLDDLFEMQRRLQVEHMGGDPAELDTPATGNELKIQFIKDMVMALEDELHEALGEVGWKPWAKSKHITVEAYKEELVDALHFFINLCLVVSMGSQELMDRYLRKNEKNAKRQVDGYDGVSTKCPACHRALDDIATKCYTISPTYVWCQYYHASFPKTYVKGNNNAP